VKNNLSSRIEYHNKNKEKSMFSRGYASASSYDARKAKAIGRTYIQRGMLHDDLNPSVKAYRLGHMAYLQDAGLDK
jgi:hypothetical protein